MMIIWGWAHRIEEALDVGGVHPGALLRPQVGSLAPQVQQPLSCGHCSRPRLRLRRPERHRVPHRLQLPQFLPACSSTSQHVLDQVSPSYDLLLLISSEHGQYKIIVEMSVEIHALKILS